MNGNVEGFDPLQDTFVFGGTNPTMGFTRASEE